VWSIAVRQQSDGNIVATTCGDEVMRLFDLHSSTTGNFKNGPNNQ